MLVTPVGVKVTGVPGRSAGIRSVSRRSVSVSVRRRSGGAGVEEEGGVR
jgi:hypothetical protein